MNRRYNFTLQEIVDFYALQREGIPDNQISTKMAMLSIARRYKERLQVKGLA